MHSSTNCLLCTGLQVQGQCTLFNTLLLVKLCSHRYFLPVFATGSFPCQNLPVDSSPFHLACFLLTPELFGNCFNKYLWSLCIFQGSLCFFQTLSWQISGYSQPLSEILWAEHPQKGPLGDLVSVGVWEPCWFMFLFLRKWILEKTFQIHDHCFLNKNVLWNNNL